MAFPEPTEVSPWYLRNITQALELNAATGQVFVRTNAAIVGNVSVGNVAIGSLGNVDISGNTLPISGNIVVSGGNINANVSGNVGILGNVNVTQGTDPWIVSGNVGISGNANVVLADDANVVISGFSGAVSDAFGRLRVSDPYSLFETQARYFDHKQFANSISGTANVVYVQDQSSYQLNVGQVSGDSVIRETLKPFPYQPGKSQLTLNTFCFATPKIGLRQRVGLFDANDGVYFETSGTTNYFVIRSGSTGVEERIAQSAWNVDRLNPSLGLNPSGYTLSVDRTQIMFADVEWLGVGSVRVGFVINGAYLICHQFNHANQPGNTKVYMTTATLPIRYEITNTANTTSVSQLTQICSTVISEGGFQLAGSGNPRAASHDIATPVRLPNDLSFKPVIAIRLKSTNLNAVVIPINYSLVPTAGSIFQFRVYKKAITSGGSWVDSAADSSVQYNLAPTALVSGDIAEQSFINSTNQSTGAPTQERFTFEYQLERDPFTGVPYEYVITMATTGTNQDVYASVEWQEIT
jgi:ATP-dependent protease HslVU (ClpYQ) peptidase subunit